MRSLLLVLALLLGFSMAGLAQKYLPDFSFTTLTGESFTKTQLDADRATLVMYYDPWCDHCAEQAELIAKASTDFKDIQLIFVSNTDPEGDACKAFQKKHFGDKDLPHLHFLLDPNFQFDAYFGYSEAPSIYAYDKAGKKAKAFFKEASAEQLLESMK